MKRQVLPQDAPRDDTSLDLARSFVNAGDSDIPDVSFDREVANVTVAAVHLEGAIANAVGGLGREELGDRRLAGECHGVVLQRRGTKAKQPRRVELGFA